ncbi:sensor histidine kinase [Mucilaginibacter sp. OK283]|uniref:sensor histidine kinase n=1 Tax=Mucilaginibacter sp. OK283 TaxID=1881049 RepID=UPI0008AFAECE|nr:histidine kinase [Mucilaginibacter sp. OK283]SEP40303.1 Histidine kinase [Mucilaginibacter sp. OK283]
MKKTIFISKYHWLLPIVIWIGVFFLLFLFQIMISYEELDRGKVLNTFLLIQWAVCLFFVHTYFLLPIIRRKNGKLIYILLLITGLILHVLILINLQPDVFSLSAKNILPLKSRVSGEPLFFPLAPYVIVIFHSYCYRLYIDQVKQNHILKELETVNVKMELQFLRSQISPHFIFNLINTLVSLARKKSELLEDSLINLAQLLRYMLYDINDQHIPLNKEIEYLKTYVDLQLLRFGDGISFNLLVNGSFEGYNIEPMILIPFIENTFKHGTDSVAHPLIDVAICVNEKKRILNMTVKNSVNKISKNQDHRQGIGLANVQRRLMLLYPGRHQILLSETNDTYNVNLEISLST